MAISGHENDRQRGPHNVDSSSQINTIHFRHSEVEKDEIDLQVA
jgi:hypothetical protein